MPALLTILEHPVNQTKLHLQIEDSSSHIEAAKGLHGLRYQGAHLIGIRHVGLDEHGLPASAIDEVMRVHFRVLGLFARLGLLSQIGAHEQRALASVRKGDGAAQAGARARHDGDLSVETLRSHGCVMRFADAGELQGFSGTSIDMLAEPAPERLLSVRVARGAIGLIAAETEQRTQRGFYTGCTTCGEEAGS